MKTAENYCFRLKKIEKNYYFMLFHYRSSLLFHKVYFTGMSVKVP